MGIALFLADLDGSGTPDLIYAHHDHLAVYRNQCGNGFGPQERLPLPHAYDSLTQLRFADVLGNGAACLVLTSRPTRIWRSATNMLISPAASSLTC